MSHQNFNIDIKRRPIITVPTSVGTGVAHDGTVALHSMLSSCANGNRIEI